MSLSNWSPYLPIASPSAVSVSAVLEALRRQTRQPDLIVGVNNQSSDASSDLLRAAGAKLIKEGAAAGKEKRKTLIYVNNRLEGNALATIEAMVEQAEV